MLTKRQAEVLSLVAKHKKTPEIADLLGLSKRTVDMHILSAMDRLGAKSRHEAAQLAKLKANKTSHDFIDSLVDEDTLIKFIENIPYPVAMLDRDLRYIAHSRDFKSIFEEKNKQLIGKTHFELFPKSQNKQKKVIECSLEKNISKEMIGKIEVEKGLLKKLQWQIKPWHISGNHVGGIILSYQLIQELSL